MFLQDTPRQLTDLRESVQKGDSVRLVKVAHTLKGSAANLGAREMVRICAELQVLGEAEDIRIAPSLIADLEIQVTALEYTELRALSSMAHGGQPGPEVSGLKIRGSEIQQRITELAMEAVGEYAAPYLPGLLWHGTNEEPVGPSYAHVVAPRYFNTRKTTIYGGSNEIQKGIISKMVLGL